MKIEVNVENNIFYILYASRIVKQIPAYVLKTLEGNYIFGEKAFRAIPIYSQHIYGFNEIIISGNYELLKQLLIYLKSRIEEISTDSEISLNFGHVKKSNIENIVSQVFHNNAENYIDSKTEFFMKNGEYKLILKKDNSDIVVDKNTYYCVISIITQYLLNKLTLVDKDINNKELWRFRRIIFKKFEDIQKKLKENNKISIIHKYITLDGKVKKVHIPLSYDELCNINELKIFKNINKSNEEKIYKYISYKQDEKYKVVVVSPFSYGKSTILNSIIGSDILKMDIRAETAIITKIVYSHNKFIYFTKKDGSLDIISYEDKNDIKNILNKYTGARDDNNDISEIKVNYPIDNLEGITFVDSPGLFSMHKDHNELCEKALKDGDIILFIIDPAKLGDRNFTDKIMVYTNYLKKCHKEFCFVLSKLDLYEEDEDKLMNELQIVLSNIGLEDTPIFFVSGYFGLKGKQLKENEIALDEVRKSRGIFVIDNDEFLTGKSIEKYHCDNLIEFSRIDKLVNYIKERRKSI